MSNCPAPEIWHEFTLGLLAAAEHDYLATHLSECTECQLRLTQSSQQEIAPWEALKRAVQQPPLPEESECQSLAERACSVWTDEAGSDTVDRATDQADCLLLPKRLGPYEILELVNSGGMGHIYRARHTRLNRIVALKTLQPHRFADSLMQARFNREMHASGMLSDHANLVRATDANEEGGIHFLVMDFIPGENVYRLSQQFGPLRCADACEIVRQAAVGLSYLHSAGLVHRDFKPSNLMVTPDGVVKVLDLGLARLPHDGDDDGALTGAWTVVGTPDFMSPEQIFDAHRVGPAADFYGLGCTLFQLLTGRPPFDAPNYATRPQKFRAHTMETPPRLSESRPDAPPELANLVQRLLAKEAKDRPASARNVIEELAPFCQGHDLPGFVRACAEAGAPTALGSETPRLPSDTISLRRSPLVTWSRRQRWAAGAFGLLVLIAGLGFLSRPLWSNLLHHNEEEPPETGEKAINLQQYVPDQNHSALRRQPKPLIWANPGNSRVDWNPNGDAVTSIFTGPQGLLSCGDMQAEPFRLEVQMFQTSWAGQAGIFFGFQGEKQNGDWVKWSYETITVERVPEPPAKPGAPPRPPPKFRYGLYRTRQWGERLANGKYDTGSQILAADGIADPEVREYTLSIRCAKNFLIDVRWNGLVFESLTDFKVKSAFPRQYKGQFGTFQSENTTTFRQFRFMLFPESE
jgi:serine/threonine protein kinase